MQNFKQTVEDAVKENGIDLIGFAPRERFVGVPAQNAPFAIFPERNTLMPITPGSAKMNTQKPNKPQFIQKNPPERVDFLHKACYYSSILRAISAA